MPHYQLKNGLVIQLVKGKKQTFRILKRGGTFPLEFFPGEEIILAEWPEETLSGTFLTGGAFRHEFDIVKIIED